MDTDKVEAVERLYKQGLTLREVGKEVGRSHEWVRQTLQLLDVPLRPRSDPGTEEERQQRVAAFKEEFKAKWGLLPEELYKIEQKYGKGPRGPLSRYGKQKSSAKRRGIGWEFKFGDWWDVWKKSKKWGERGRGGYVMGRKKDRGPYAPGNVKIITAQQNGLEATITAPFANRNYKIRVGGCSRKRKLSNDQVREIRSSTESNRELGDKYGVDQSLISNIRRNKAYKDVI